MNYEKLARRLKLFRELATHDDDALYCIEEIARDIADNLVDPRHRADFLRIAGLSKEVNP